MFGMNIKTNINNTQTKPFSNRISKIPSSPGLPPRQQSVQSLHKINKHYNEFQHALYMLKTSVEELWRLELEQLRNNIPISPVSSNIRFDLQVPSIYTCRAVLPMASETIHLKNIISSSRVKTPIILQPSPTPSTQEVVSNKMGVREKMLQSSIQSVDRKKMTNESLLSINTKQKQYGSGDNFTKYRSKTALLHLKFRCLKHMH